MDDAATFPDWPAKRDAIRATLAAREPRLYHAGPLRLGDGVVVEPDGIMPALVARRAFLEIAAAVAPRLLVELAGAPLDQYQAVWDELGGPACADLSPSQMAALNDALLLPAQRAMVDPDGALWRWCERWGLPVWEEMTPETLGPDERSLLRFAATRGWGLLEGASVLYSWRVAPFDPGLPHTLGQILLTTPLVDDRDLGVAATLDLPPPRWDPQREDRGAAARRIDAELRGAVRAELRRIEADALRVGVVLPERRTGLEHLAWLARHHFRHEPYSAIAKNARVTRQSVTEAVKQAAALVGLPLREPTRSRRRHQAARPRSRQVRDARSLP